MIRKEFPDSWHGQALPGGQYAISHLGPDVHVQTHLGRIEGDILWTRCFNSPNGFRVAGATHEGDKSVEWTGREWLTKGPAFGMNSVCYDRVGVLHLATLPDGAQGIRFFTDSNVKVTGDQTSFDDRTGLHNWISRAGYIIGQETGDRDWTVVYCPDGSRRLLEDGTCKFIQFEVEAPNFAITIVKEKGGRADKTVVYFGELSELDTLPLTIRPGSLPGPSPDPSPAPTPAPTPTPMPSPPPSQIEKVAARRAQFPNWPVGHADCMILIARDLNGKLQRKESSPSAIRLPSGHKVSPDGVVLNGWFVDVLGDAEGAGTPAWDPKGPALPEWELLDPFQEPLSKPQDAPGPLPDPSPAPTPLPDPDDALEVILDRLNAIEDALAAIGNWNQRQDTDLVILDQSIDELRSVVEKPRSYEVKIGKSWGHSHSATVKEIV